MANKYFRAILIFVLMTEVIYAQITPPPPIDPEVPIDGGIIGLLLLGVGYAVKKIHDNSKK